MDEFISIRMPRECWEAIERHLRGDWIDGPTMAHNYELAVNELRKNLGMEPRNPKDLYSHIVRR